MISPSPRRPCLVALIAALAVACSDPAVDPAADAATPADAPTATAVDAPSAPGVQLRAHAVNIVDPAAAAEAREYILGRSPQLYVGAASFYARFADDYDFLYVFTDAPVPNATTYARFTPVRRPATPSVGLTRALTDTRYGDHPRLRGAVGVNFTAGGNGPTIHETLHYWATFLDARFGFGRDRDQGFGAHWGVAGVHGQHGGFDPATLRCSTPAEQPPPCAPDADGVTRVSMAAFGPTANGGDSQAYAPLELYLMGLLPRAEVPSPVLVLDGAHFVRQDTATRRMIFEITGTHAVTMDDIVAVHGERPAAAAGDRAFRGAFVSFSDAPLSAERMDALERWAAVFGNAATSRGLLSFEAATGGRATMDTRLEPPR
jgi:hypothetical protein